jgi:hypothetical protein
MITEQQISKGSFSNTENALYKCRYGLNIKTWLAVNSSEVLVNKINLIKI